MVGKQVRKKAATKSRPTTNEATTISTIDQQKCLDVFKNALWTSNEDLKSIQAVKGHLYRREFLEAFSKPDYQRAYALRWSASRALGYSEVFRSLNTHFHLNDREPGKPLSIISLGGGAGAELVGIASWVKHDLSEANQAVSVRLVDIADWDEVVNKLYKNITEPPVLSQYASAAAISRNTAYLAAGLLDVTFTQSDVLKWDAETMQQQRTGNCDLVTLLFTLNELYSTSLHQTQAFLKLLTASMKHGSLLLVVDSPGSYSSVTLNGNDKKYPMQWLLDHTLLEASKKSEPAWKKIISEESIWFRLSEDLTYPVELENMRYQMHLYQRQRD